MEYGSSILSLMFFSASFIYLFWGIYVVRINRKEAVSRVFFSLSIFLFIWTFGYGMTNSAIDLETALFWRRISAIGKTFFFSTMLHFMLLLANKDVSIKQKKLFMLIHIPAFINIYIFALSNTMASIQYNMIKIDYGWINKPVINIWSLLYYCYFILYIMSSLIIVGKLKKEFKSKPIKRQANLFYITFIAVLIVGTFTDIVVSSMFRNPLPQMTPLFALFPVWIMYYSARYYDVLDIKKVKKEEIIISNEQQKNIFINLSIGICISGILAFAFGYFSDKSDNSGDLKTSLIEGGLLIILGLSIFFIQRIKKESLKEVLTTVVLISSIPMVTFQFSKYSSVTVWVYPIIIIIISSFLFNKRTLLIATTIVAIITQILVWIFRPETYVLVDKYDFMQRIIIFIVISFLGSYINKIYIAKIKENDYQIAFQKLNLDISFDFIALNQENFNDNVNNLLMRIGTFFKVDRTYLFIINYQDDTMKYSNEWCNTGIDPETRINEELSIEVFPWWINQLKRNKLIYIENVENMPKEANLEKEQLLIRNVKSVVLIPILGEDEIQGFIGVDSVLSTKEWVDEDIKRLNIIGNILSSGMTQIKSDKEIEFMAYYDNLTKLPNRFLFADKVNQAIHLSKGTGKFISIIFIDLDNFKLVNDTIGHKGGDILLKEVAQRLVSTLRKTDMVARFGGDEFIIMINNITDYNMVTKIADKIMKTFLDTFTVNDQEFIITASAGISIYPVDGEDSDTLLKNADIAIYKAKAKGKNQYALCTKEIKDEIQMDMQLSNDLYRALERNELIVYYQPQVDLITNKITGVEALIRWMHPTRGMILPGIFIPIAEKNSLINSIGEWVLRTACIQNKKWQDMGLPYMDMAVNLSAIQIMNPKIVENIENILKKTGLDPQYMELEITESIAIKETEYVLNVLNKLKKIGVSIAIDDFGTEYSSLSRLKLLPVDRIKIDMQFIQGIENNEKDKAITKVIINLAKSLGLNVLAEGVETAPQLEFLNQKMCDYVQGYYYYKPMPPEEMEKTLQESHSEVV